MNQAFNFAVVAAVIAISFVVALWLEWLLLRGFMRLMPATRVTKPQPLMLVRGADGRPTRAKAA